MLREATAIPSATHAPAAARRCHARPTEHSSVSSEERGAVAGLAERGAWKSPLPETAR